MARGKPKNPLLTQIENLFPALFDLSQAAVMIYLRRGRVAYLNHAMRSMWSFPADLLDNAQIDPILDQIMNLCRCDRGKLLRIVRPIRLKKVENTFTFERTDDRRITCHSRPLVIENRWVAQFLRFVDVTAQYDLEIRLNEKSSQFERMANCLPEPIFEIDLNGRVIYANDAAYEKFGYPKGGYHFDAFEIIAPVDRERAIRNVRRVLNGEELFGVEYQIQRRDGTCFPAIVHSRIIMKDRTPTGLTGFILDQTYKKQADEALRASEAKLRSIFDNSLQSFILLDRNMLIQTLNKTARTWIQSKFGIAMQTGQSVLNYLKSKQRPIFIETFQNTLNGSSMRGVQSAVDEDGSVCWIEIGITPVIEENGTVTGACISLLDITDQKRAEIEVMESQDRFRAMVQNSTDIITILDLQGKFLFISPSITRILGYTESELVGRNAFDYLHPDDHDSVFQEFMRLAASSTIVIAPEFRFRHADGHYVDLESIGNNLLNDPSIKGIVINSRDVTERKRAESAFALERERLNVTLQSIADGVISMGVELDVTFMNRVAEALTGWNQENARGRPIDEILTLLDEKSRRPYDITAPFFSDPGALDYNRQQILVSKLSEERLVETSCAPILREDGILEGRVLVLRDIALRRKSEEELLKAAKLESIGVLAGGIAHDFNNIMTGIVGSVYIAKMLAGHDERVRKVLIDAERAAMRAKDLTHQLITFSKGSNPVKTVISLRDVILNSVSFILRKPNIKWETDIPEDLWAIEADENQICQVIHNLLINAEQAMPQGGWIRIRCANVPGTSIVGLPVTDKQYVMISIADEGIGIQDAFRDKIFDPYFTTKKSGSGLGLTTSFSIINRHNGFLTFDSTLMNGTTFHIYLPASPGKTPVRRSSDSEVFRGTGRILVMDDDAIIIDVTCDALNMLGYEAVAVRNGEDAIRLYQNSLSNGTRFSAVILDLIIADGMGGAECNLELCKLDPDVISIITSGYSNDPILLNYPDYGFKAILPKPFNAEQLSALLHGLLATQDSSITTG